MSSATPQTNAVINITFTCDLGSKPTWIVDPKITEMKYGNSDTITWVLTAVDTSGGSIEATFAGDSGIYVQPASLSPNQWTGATPVPVPNTNLMEFSVADHNDVTAEKRYKYNIIVHYQANVNQSRNSSGYFYYDPEIDDEMEK